MALRTAGSHATPYAMDSADETARKLGVRDGQWVVFDSHSGDFPSLKGGLDGGRPTLILQWRLGQ